MRFQEREQLENKTFQGEEDGERVVQGKNPELEQNGDGEGIKRSVQASYPLCMFQCVSRCSRPSAPTSSLVLDTTATETGNDARS